ncbi:MAG: protoporphyrinogen oxidase [Chloroflexota bacterium]
MSRVVIVGGGITGLAAAWELQQQGVEYTLLESADRLGGKIKTDRVDGFVIEGAADSFLTQKPAAWQLCREIGLADRLIGTNDERRNVYVYKDGKLQLFPGGMRLIVPLDPAGLLQSDLLSESGKRRMLAEPDIPPRTDTADESLAAFVERRFGAEALEVFGESLLAGIHVADPQKLSIAAAFPNYVKYERTYGSVIRGMQSAAPAAPNPDAPKTAFVSLRGGMIELIEGLAARLTGDIRTGQAITRIASDRTVYTSTGEKFKPDAIILTTPAQPASKMLSQAAPELSAALAALTTVSSGTVSLGFRAAEIDHPLNGFGFVIPRSEPTRILAGTWSSSKLAYRAPEGYVLIRVFIGGHGREADVELPDDQLVALARSELQKIMGITAEPVISRVFRWRNANPQYTVGHLDRVAHFNALSPAWLFLAGCTYDGVGIPDCVRQGRQIAGYTAQHVIAPENIS